MEIFKKGVFLFVLTSLSAFTTQAQTVHSLIPQPTTLKEVPGTFSLTPELRISSSPAFTGAAKLWSEQSFGKALTVSPLSGNQSGLAQVIFEQKKATNPADSDAESYQLRIEANRIHLTAATVAGAQRGVQTLLQLADLQPDPRQLPGLNLTDAPRFGYRGMHLDVSRHFFDLDFVKRYIDLMALYKFNTFHWHLTDGAGWRLEIEKYPALTQRAAWRTHRTWKEWWASPRRYSREGDPNAYGGYYTQDEARELVAYAARRGITVIPEIEMPGHSEEVLAVYPHLSCSGEPYANSEFCLGNDSTFTFLEDVLTEVLDIFPSKYIHIGGDEASTKAWKKCPKCQRRIKEHNLADEHALQSYAVRRMDQFLEKKGRKMIGWDEILHGDTPEAPLAEGATVMSWRGESGGIAAAQKGHDVIMTPGGYVYFDSYQANPTTQPEAIGGFLPLKKVYGYEPIPKELTPTQAKHVLGAQANIWTEYVPTMEHLEYMVFPRLLALSEVVWSDSSARDWPGFQRRLQDHYLLLQRRNVNYYRPGVDLEILANFQPNEWAARVEFRSEQYQPEIRYTLDGSEPTARSSRYAGPFSVKESASIKAALYRDGAAIGPVAALPVDFHKAFGKPITYGIRYTNSYPAQGDGTLVNGNRGSFTYGDQQWLGFEGIDMDVTIDLEKVQPLQEVQIGLMQLTGPGVYMPRYVEVSLSQDGKTFSAPVRVERTVPESVNSLVIKDVTVPLDGQSARYIRIFAKNNKGYMFADEIRVH
ncbi:glycoside hydrolase family 20 protein [Persicitalea jodogahamensis]|uniref:beta-N-acetylhexosaminidase n=1 Tax=Persicitalea jodogahamensis TaxID=402147 RepID=A0A8J3D853_9BACT|nr:family 20 glycosylhydrolase [Persicitalea jodogahamensis]GHB86912.1 beta-N-acetylhexosaminidase [Persicitalea jodogahamensis]